MAAALYDPEDGFFTSKTLRSVKAGDFLTSPEVSPLFGETLARFVDQELSASPWKGEVPERSEGDGGRALPGESESEAATPFRGPRTADGAPGIVPPASEAGSGGVQVDGSGIVPPVSEASHGGKVPQPERSAGWGRGALLIEVGAGSGSLLKPLLATVQTTVEPWGVEASPAARHALEDILPPDHIVPTLNDLPDRLSGVVIANELLDNLPVAMAVRTGNGWTERWVGVEDEALVLVPVDARPEVADWAERFGLPAPERGLVEVQLAAGEWLEAILDRLDSGTVLLIDYGDTAENLEKRRVEGTLRTYRAHHLGPHPLDEPGETDITVDVNFTALIDRSVQLGASIEYHRQDDFLSELGLRSRLSKLRHHELDLARDGDPMERLKVRSANTEAETLLHPRGLGDFRVLVVRTS